LLLPSLKPARPAAALRGVGVRGQTSEYCKDRESGCRKFICLGHLKNPLA
jgi:hypothetical protein